MTIGTMLVRRREIRLRLCALFLGATVAVGCSGVRPAQAPPPAPFAGFPSEEALLDEFVAAVAARDTDALHRLRVTDVEYREVIIPGTAPVGKTMQGALTDKKFSFFWSMLNTKSRDYADLIVNNFGGHRWRRERYWHTQEPQQYSGYRALGEVRIAVVDEEGRTGTMRSGTIADVGGRYKFIGFQYDGD